MMRGEGGAEILNGTCASGLGYAEFLSSLTCISGEYLIEVGCRISCSASPIANMTDISLRLGVKTLLRLKVERETLFFFT